MGACSKDVWGLTWRVSILMTCRSHELAPVIAYLLRPPDPASRCLGYGVETGACFSDVWYRAMGSKQDP